MWLFCWKKNDFTFGLKRSASTDLKIKKEKLDAKTTKYRIPIGRLVYDAFCEFVTQECFPHFTSKCHSFLSITMQITTAINCSQGDRYKKVVARPDVGSIHPAGRKTETEKLTKNRTPVCILICCMAAWKSWGQAAVLLVIRWNTKSLLTR